MSVMAIQTLEQNRDHQGAAVSAYLITFVCYGTWLPGQAGAVGRRHNLFGSPLPPTDVVAEARGRELMRHPAYLLDGERRSIVLRSMQQVCRHRDWILLAGHVRTNHAV